MSNRIIQAGALPYDDGSGFELEIVVEGPSQYYPSVHIVLNPDTEFCDFGLDKWPEVRAAIDRAYTHRVSNNSVYAYRTKGGRIVVRGEAPHD